MNREMICVFGLLVFGVSSGEERMITGSDPLVPSAVYTGIYEADLVGFGRAEVALIEPGRASDYIPSNVPLRFVDVEILFDSTGHCGPPSGIVEAEVPDTLIQVVGFDGSYAQWLQHASRQETEQIQEQLAEVQRKRGGRSDSGAEHHSLAVIRAMRERTERLAGVNFGLATNRPMFVDALRPGDIYFFALKRASDGGQLVVNNRFAIRHFEDVGRKVLRDALRGIEMLPCDRK